jgi:hypothetical protein
MIRKFVVAKHWLSYIVCILALVIVLVDSFIADSIMLSVLGILMIGCVAYSGYVIIQSLGALFLLTISRCHVCDKRQIAKGIAKGMISRIFRVDFLFLVIVTISMGLIRINAEREIGKYSEAVANKIISCNSGDNCEDVNGKIMIKRYKGFAFSITYGVTSIFARTRVNKEGCLEIFSPYVGKVIDVKRCEKSDSDDSGSLLAL